MHKTVFIACSLLATVAVSCGAQESPGEDPRPARETARERLLASCPARAPDFTSGRLVPSSDEEAYEFEMSVAEQQERLHGVESAADDYFDTLSANQVGTTWVDNTNNRMVFQVTRDADEVLARLRAEVERPDKDKVAVETTRWSTKELGAFRARIESLPNLGLVGAYHDGPNGRVEVMVSGNAEEARRRISEIIDPCAFKIEGNVTPLSP